MRFETPRPPLVRGWRHLACTPAQVLPALAINARFMRASGRPCRLCRQKIPTCTLTPAQHSLPAPKNVEMLIPARCPPPVSSQMRCRFCRAIALPSRSHFRTQHAPDLGFPRDSGRRTLCAQHLPGKERANSRRGLRTLRTNSPPWRSHVPARSRLAPNHSDTAGLDCASLRWHSDAFSTPRARATLNACRASLRMAFAASESSQSAPRVARSRSYGEGSQHPPLPHATRCTHTPATTPHSNR